MQISQNDIAVLRELAKEYMEVASLPVQREKMTLWKSFNANTPGSRPMVIIDQLPWNELNNEGELTLSVENPLFRQVEWNLRSTLYKWRHFPVDMVVEPFITIPSAIQNKRLRIKSRCGAAW